MSRGNALKDTIDRMVEDSIRRILPTVMNEVLIRTLANSAVVNEDRPAPRRKPPKRRKPVPVREARAPQRPGPKPRRPTKRGLDDILAGIRDDSAGAEFFEDPRQAMRESAVPDEDDFEIDVEDDDDSPPPPRVESRLSSLPPELRGLAEGMQLDDEPDEMWDSPFGDSTPMGLTGGGGSAIIDPTPIRDIDRAAKAAGVDFSRMKSVIRAVEPPKPNRRELAEDARARTQFEQARINRMREKLGGVKPAE